MKRQSKFELTKNQRVIIIILAVLTVAILFILAALIFLNLMQKNSLSSVNSAISPPTPLGKTSTQLSLPATWTSTPFNSSTPKPSSTPIFTVTPFTIIFVEITPTNNEISTPQITVTQSINDPTRNPTTPIIPPTFTNTVVPTNIPTKAPTKTPTPKITYSCGITPSTISGATNTTLTFWVQFSPNSGGLGFNVSEFDPEVGTGQRGCSATENSSGYASCTGSSGMLAYGQTVKVTIATSVGICITNYIAQ